jgi:hypothetical protein
MHLKAPVFVIYTGLPGGVGHLKTLKQFIFGYQYLLEQVKNQA